MSGVRGEGRGVRDWGEKSKIKMEKSKLWNRCAIGFQFFGQKWQHNGGLRKAFFS
jgi:hypothetical protein